MRFVEYESPTGGYVAFDLDQVKKVETLGKDDGRILLVTLDDKVFAHVSFGSYGQLIRELKDRR